LDVRIRDFQFADSVVRPTWPAFPLLLINLHLRYELLGRQYLGGPESRWKVLDVAGHEVLRTRRRGAFEEPVVGLIWGHFERLGWCRENTLDPGQVKELTHPFGIET
jgi:hypothetical protein